MTNSLVPKPFDVTDAKRAREEESRKAERRDGAAWSGVIAETVAREEAVSGETAAREELAADTEAEARANRDAIVAEALARAEAFIDVDAKLDAIDEAYDGVITDAGQLGQRLDTAETDLTAAQGRLSTTESELVDAFGQISTVDGKASEAVTAASEARARADSATAAAAEAYKSVTNMVVNGGFEQGWLGWTREGSGGTLDTTVGYDGTTSFKTNNIGGGNQPYFPVVEDETWRLSGWYKTEPGFLSGTHGGLRMLRQGDAGSGSISSSNPVESLDWTRLTIDYKVPVGVRKLAARFAYAMVGQKNLWLDDIRMENVTSVKVLEAAAAAADAKAVAAKLAADAANAELALVPAKIEAAKQAAEAAAITVAKADAKLQAEAAEARAAVTAAADAKTKADAAQAAALAAAKAYADAEASGAGADALAAAKADATAKADAAKAAAIAAAALDATAKKEQAEANAALDAKIKADKALADAKADAAAKVAQALADAKADATAKADAAKQAAIDAAALVAQAKANAAEAAAKADAATDAKTKADAAQAAAIAAAKTASDLSAAGAKSEAIAAATADAKTKADAAQAAAIAAAAADATAKAAQAKTDATTIAANDATAKANTAKADAIAAASLDATAKAGQAKTDAIASATTMTNGIGKNLSSTAIPTTFNTAPQGSIWRRTDGSGRIIGVWEQTGSGVAGTWTPRLITSETIDNLDVGKLSASGAVIHTLVSQKIAAAVGAFLELDVGQLRVTGSSTMAEAVIAKLWTDVVMSRKITTQMLAVGSFDNLINEPDFTDGGESWALGAGRAIVAGQGRSAGPVLRLTANGAIVSAYNEPQRRSIDSGSAWRISAWVRSSANAVAGAAWLFAATFTAAGTSRFPLVLSPPLVAGQWTLISGVLKSSDTETTASFAVSTRANFPSSATLDFDFVSATRMNAGELTVDGTVTAKALETELVLTTKVVAGDPASTHAEMSPLGFKVFAAGIAGGAPTEVVRLGVASTDDYFAITKSDGTLVATISQDGVIVGDQLNATNALWYKGDELQTILDRMPRGIIAAGYRATSSTVNASFGNIIPYLRIEAPLVAGRVYKVWTSGVRIGLDAGTRASVGIKYANNNGIATISSPALTETVTDTDLEAPIVQELFAVSTDQSVSFMLYLQVLNSGQAGFRGSGGVPTRLVVEDAGPMTSQLNNGVHMNGTVTPPPAVNTYKKQYGSTGSMNYQGSNAQYSYDTGHMYQGLSPAGMGNLKSISIHPSMTADLSGATINYVRVYFNFGHWYYNAGGTARIGLHGHASIPGSFSGSGIAATSYGWPRPGARWVDLPASTFAGFKSGAYKGIYLEGDGTYGTYGIADRPTIEIGYTK